MNILALLNGTALLESLSSLEKIALLALSAIDAGANGSITLTASVSAELEALLPSVSSKIAAVEAKVEGAEKEVKTAVESALAWLEARVETTATATSADGTVAPRALHIS